MSTRENLQKFCFGLGNVIGVLMGHGDGVFYLVFGLGCLGREESLGLWFDREGMHWGVHNGWCTWCV